MTINQLLEIKNDTDIFLFSKQALKYGDLKVKIKKTNYYFQSLNIKKGDRIAIVSNDEMSVLSLFFSALNCGIVSVIFNPDIRNQNLSELMAFAECKALFIDHDISFTNIKPLTKVEIKKEKKSLLNKFKKVDKNVNQETYPSCLKNLQDLVSKAEITDEDEALILFTSGSTSAPKAVVLSHLNIFSHMKTLKKHFEFNNNTRLLNLLPFHHVDGLLQGALLSFYSGSALYRSDSFTIQNIESILDSVYAHRITHFTTVPTMLALILEYGKEHHDSFQTEDFKFIISTAGKLRSKLWRDFENHFKIQINNVYGLTETVSGSLFTSLENHDEQIATNGKAIDCDCRIVDEEGREVPDGEIGELIISGDHVMKSYLKNNDAIYKDNYLYTGDLFKKNEFGYYEFINRKKNVINSGGISIYPNEITEVLLKHDNIINAITVAVEDEIWEEIPVSVVEIINCMSQTEVEEFAAKHLPPELQARKIFIMEKLPIGPSGKILIPEVKKYINTQLELNYSTAVDINEIILDIASTVFKTAKDELTVNSSIENTRGWDSLAHMELVTSLENKFKIKFTTSEILNMSSLAFVNNLIKTK